MQICEKFHSKDKNIRRKDIAFIYSRANLLRGHEFILTISKKVNDPDKSGVPKRRLFYAHRPFRSVELTENDSINEFKVEAVRQEHAVVNVVVRLGGSYAAFASFMENFERFHLISRQNVSLTILLVRGEMNHSATAAISSYVNRLRAEYSVTEFTVTIVDSADRSWLRNVVERFNNDDLLLFIDADMFFLPVLLQRARLNTVKTQTAYLSNVFNPFDALNVLFGNTSSRARIVAAPARCHDSYACHKYGHGMAMSIYKGDLVPAVSSQEIKESVQNDADLLERILLSRISIFRSSDDGLAYRFHAGVCDLACAKQSKMCLNRANVSAIGSIEALSEFIYETPYLLNRSKT